MTIDTRKGFCFVFVCLFNCFYDKDRKGTVPKPRPLRRDEDGLLFKVLHRLNTGVTPLMQQWRGHFGKHRNLQDEKNRSNDISNKTWKLESKYVIGK